VRNENLQYIISHFIIGTSLHCKDGRAVELNVVITVAPGVLANYTSIIRIVPRYAIVNNLPYPVRIWQDSSTFSNVGGSELTSKKASKWRSSIGDNDMSRINQYELLWGRPAVLNERQTAPAIGGTAARRSALYITTVYPSEIIPFCLPDSRGERQLRIDPGDPWDLSGSISTSKPGDFTLAMKQAVDSTAILHESSRASPHYEVRLPPHGTTSFDGDLGIWFESDYGANTGLIVKAIRKNSYCFNETEVHVGDELLYLNKIQLKGLAFDKAIDALKRHLFDLSSRRVDDGNVATPIKHGRNSIIRKSLRYQKDKDQPQQTSAAPSMVLTFRTVEERIRQVMIKAATTDTASYQSHEYFNRSRGSNETTRNGESSDSGFFIKAELKNYPRSHLGLFLVLREESTAPYELLNQSITYTIYYRQRDCDHLKWQFLKPGKSRRYAWDEPLKPKKLVIRVDSQNLFAHMGNLSVCNQSSDARKPLRSEDDVYFPKSALVPLDEVGYHETLSLQDTSVKNDSLKVPLCCLQFDVDVSRNHRILVVRDVPTDDSQRQMDQWLSELNQQVQHEEKRKNNLRDVTNRYTESNTATTMDFKRLVETNDLEDFFGQDDIVITECHQIFVEILEATGISSDTINASCNPYCDVRLKHGHNRNRLFGIRDRRRTYYIRKTFTPVWNKQSFVFHVPPEAAVVTRGYKLILRVRNYSPFRSHQVLGYARIDLHSVRDQKSHIGWFPLVGRNGRPELNTHGSHLGRGSVRVRVQWIYTMPALVQYFEILSESRIVAIQENISVIAKQLERLAESENEIRAGLDGIQAVRIEDLLSFPKYKRKENIDNLRRQKVKASTVKKNAGPLVSCEESLPESSSKKSQDYLTELPVLLRPHSHERGFKRTANSLHAIAHNLEKQISQKRLHRLNFTRQQFDEVLNTANGLIPLSLIRSWNMIQALLTDVDVEVKFNSNYIEATPRPNVLLSEASKALLGVYNPEVMNGIELKLYPPERAPRWMQTSTNAYINEWIKSRSSFDRTARISMKTVLHSGGWLSIRPITALNLPDVFTGMAVKIQYGSETYVSDTADIRSLDPSWYKINHRDSDAGDWELVSHNDMHIHIAPQLTSGTIRLSIIGEKKHKRPSSKTEIGVVYLPLGATVSCLLDCEESRLELLRWFPLSLVTARMEGDGGLGVRPPDTEKESDSDFKEYFAPCIQLALFWSPDNGNVSVNKITNDSQHTEGQKPLVQDSTESTNNQMNMERQPSFVKNYLNADIGWISALR
jgi:C2 domain/SHR-binding domain of vacuolar-sorting associated protein 13